MLCSENYLGLADHPRLRAAASEAITRWGVAAGGPRRGAGAMAIHARLEDRLSGFLGTESTLLFGSGYLAAMGTVTALADDPPGVVVYDELCTSGLRDGARLAAARERPFPHNDLAAVESILLVEPAGAVVVVDAVCAVDGSLAPLARLAELAARHGARLVVDESRALGCLGPGGHGGLATLAPAAGRHVRVGSLGTGLGSHGGFVSGAAEVVARVAAAAPMVTDTAAPPAALAAAALAALELLEGRPQLTAQLLDNASVLHGALADRGFEVGAAPASQILTVPLDSAAAAAALRREALADGVLVGVGATPGPSPGAFLRLSVTASHVPQQLRRGAGLLAGARRRLPRGASSSLGNGGYATARSRRER